MKIAISGKGGVGKTTLMALLANQLQKEGKEVLVIDADPSPHMAETLGIEGVENITPIADMKDMLVERSGKTDGSSFYNINPRVDDLMSRFIVEKEGIKLMVLGAIQSAGKGCACPENTVLRRLLTKLLLSSSQVVLLDMEAGVEHLGRGTIAGIDHLLIVVIPSRSGVRTAKKIHDLATQVEIPKISFVGNLITGQPDRAFLNDALEADPIAFFPDSAHIRKSERNGTSIIDAASDVDTAIHDVLKAVL